MGDAPSSGGAAATAGTVRLSVRSVSVRFGGVQALADVDIDVCAGSIHGLIGPNGAGKTTLFNVVSGLQPPDAGAVHLDGRDVTGLRPHRRARLGVARTFQRLEVCGSLTVRDNVQLAVEARRSAVPAGTSVEERTSQILHQVGLGAVADQHADVVPIGQARLVEVARALACAPTVLLVDEPSSGLDPADTAALGAVLVDLAAAGMAVLLVEHDMGLVMNVSDRLTVLDYGRVIATGDPAAVRDDPVVQAAYLGASAAEDAPRRRPASSAAVGPAAASFASVVPAASAAGRPPTAGSTADPSPANTGGASTTGTPWSADSPAISLRGVRAAYGRIEVLHGISLDVARGGVCALLGPNGAGKTTLLRVLSGRMPLTGGTASVDGVALGRVSPDGLARRGVCAVPEGRGVFANLTVAENLRMCTYRSRRLRARTVEERAYARFPRLGERRRQLAGSLSGGEQQMLALARALCTDPRVLLLDELSMGLAPLVVEELYRLVGELAASEGLTLVIVEQFAESALSLATQAAVVVNGAVVDAGTPDDVAAGLAGSYLGGAPAGAAPVG